MFRWGNQCSKGSLGGWEGSNGETCSSECPRSCSGESLACLLKGIECKDLGENRFLFTFLQSLGNRKVMEDGPWMFGKDLVILAEFHGAKTIDDVVVTSISRSG